MNVYELNRKLLDALRMLQREYETALDGKDWHKRNHQLLAQCNAIIDKAEEMELTKGGKLASPGEAPTPAQLREEQRMKKDPKKYAEWLKSYQAAKKSENKAPRLSR